MPSSFPPESGEGWYDRFVERGLSENFASRFRATKGDKAWTNLILDLTRDLGEGAGFKVVDRPEMHRWDQAWLGPGRRPIVVIEHENNPQDGDGLRGELDHLIPADAPLRVLITYFTPGTLKDKTVTLLGEIRARLDAQGIRDNEFLLLTAGWGISDVRDYRAYLITPRWVEQRL
jgi:hypothetical protein